MKFPKLKMPRLMNPKNPAHQVILLRRLEKSGMVPLGYMRKTIVEQSEKDMKKQVGKARKRGETLTVEGLTRTLKDNPEFMKFCNEQDMDLSFFESMAKRAIKEGGKS